MATLALKKSVWVDAARGGILPVATLALVGLMVIPVPALLLFVFWLVLWMTLR